MQDASPLAFAASYVDWQLVLMVAFVIFPQQAERSAQVLPAPPRVPLVPLVPSLVPLLPDAHAGAVHFEAHVANPFEQVAHSSLGAHFCRHAVSPHAHACVHVRYVPHAPLKLPFL